MPLVLFITHPEADYGGDALYRGLVNLLGDDVIEWPYKLNHHVSASQWTAKGSHPVLTDHEGYMSAQPWFRPVENPPLYVVEDLLTMPFDLIVMESNRKGVWRTLHMLADLKFQFPPIAMTCSDDVQTVTWTPFKLFQTFPIRKVFVREPISLTTLSGVPIMPLPMTCSWGDVCSPGAPMDSSRNGVYFQCSMTHPKRMNVLNTLEGFPGAVLTGNRNASSDEYGAQLRKALVGLSVRGHGIDTLRHWEVPFFGALLVTDSTIKTPEDFTHNVDCIRWNDVSQLRGILENLLRRPKRELQEMASKGQARLLQHHTNTARARYVLREMGFSC